MDKNLVTTAQLAEHLGDPDWIIFDVRHDLSDVEKGRHAYAAGHIPGAYFIHLDEDLSGTKTGKNGRHPMPEIETFAAKMNDRGVAPGKQVVIYDDAGGNYAGRLWWMLKWLGHDRVAILDGQWPLWVKGGRPVSTDVPPPRKGSFVARPQLGATVDAAFLERFHDDASIKLLDARAAERFAGLKEPIDPVAGHIPGAVNRFWQKNLDADGRFKSTEQLRREFDEMLAGASPDSVVHTCGSGVTACHNMIAMAVAGLPTGRLYPGSWSEWCSEPSRPVAKA